MNVLFTGMETLNDLTGLDAAVFRDIESTVGSVSVFINASRYNGSSNIPQRPHVCICGRQEYVQVLHIQLQAVPKEGKVSIVVKWVNMINRIYLLPLGGTRSSFTGSGSW